MKKSTKIVLGTVAGFVLIGGCGAAMSGSDTEAKPNDRAAVQPSDNAGKETASSTSRPKETEKPKSQADDFRACIQKTGMVAEKTGGTHVTKVLGAAQGETIALAEVWTNYTGGLMGGDAPKGKVLASAFASCYKSADGKSGLVTVYDVNGEILANGNY